MRMRGFLKALLGSIALLGIAGTLQFTERRAAGQAPPPQQPAFSRGPVATANPLDQPLRLIAEATQSYQTVRDYTCLFIKREKLQNQLQPDNMMEMRVRTQPFSVYFRWLGPLAQAGQEVCYVTGRNNNRMRVHSTGLAGVVGFVSLDVNDPRVMNNSRHEITEAGIGNLIERFKKRWDMERQVNKTIVRVADYTYDQRPCVRVETIHPDGKAAPYYAYRNVVYFDRQNHLPIRVETYDWPRAGGSQQGELLEAYSYVHLKLNVGLADAAFNY